MNSLGTIHALIGIFYYSSQQHYKARRGRIAMSHTKPARYVHGGVLVRWKKMTRQGVGQSPHRRMGTVKKFVTYLRHPLMITFL